MVPQTKPIQVAEPRQVGCGRRAVTVCTSSTTQSRQAVLCFASACYDVTFQTGRSRTWDWAQYPSWAVQGIEISYLASRLAGHCAELQVRAGRLLLVKLQDVAPRAPQQLKYHCCCTTFWSSTSLVLNLTAVLRTNPCPDIRVRRYLSRCNVTCRVTT
jgi:hypothetical protein